ncbi:phytanoyl-CoA dioxygenase family protein [Nonomuraea sp. NPDC001023]|uniref:phytanoyl-CoA dioxygenase family protein n=1 Tax=unclassified Nonomuraea TaxID=2593643 RepID=UPI0033303A54
MTDIDPVKLREEYDENGFAILRGVIDSELIREAGAHTAWLGQKYPDLRPEEYHHPLMRNDAFWVRMVADERLVDIAELFLGPDIACFTGHYVCKPPYDGRPVLWHQDGAYWKLDPMEALTVWVAVDASTTENGCLRVIPGSHRAAMHEPVPRSDIPNMLFSTCEEDLVQEWLDKAGEVAIELQPGDVSIHHPHLLHHSKQNTSAMRRCGLDVGYMAATTRISNEGLYLDPLLVRGAPIPEINNYRPYPLWQEGETIPFAGDAEWNERAAAMNGKYGFSEVERDESPLEAAHRMVRRLKEGTVKS